jgi:hypothetical protein
MALKTHRGQPLFQSTAFAAAADASEAMSAAAEIAEQMNARAYGPAEVGGGHLMFLWLPDGPPTFLSVTARPISAGTAWVGVSAQSLASASLDATDEVRAALELKLGNLGPEAHPPPRESEYDRGATRRLESEIQELLEDIEANPASWEQLSLTIWERELILQHLTELRA